jgi:hypothetical protein
LRGTQPSRKLRSRFRVSPGIRDAGFWPTPALSRGFSPPRRYRPAEIHHSRAFPARVTLRPRTYHVPRRLSPSAGSLVSFQPGAPTGQTLQSFTSERCALPSELRFPSCDWRPTASADTRPAYSAPHEIGRPKGWFLGRTTEGPSLSLQRCFVRFRRIGIAARAASLQGFAPSHRLGPPPPDFSACGTLCSLGFHPPWGAPLPRLGLSGCRGSFLKVHNTPAPARSLSQARSASSRHFRAPPV